MTFLNTRQLLRCSLDTVLAGAAKALTGDGEALALVYSPRCCAFCRMRSDGELTGPPKHATANGSYHRDVLAEAYEIRLFTPDWELRWLRQGTVGQAALLWEADTAKGPAPVALDWPVDPAPIELQDGPEQRYLLWGQADVTLSRDGWTALTNARIGTLWAPLHPDMDVDKGRVMLRAREYLVRKDHGNVAVIDQRLLGLIHLHRAGNVGETA